ncbi:MAG TPA: hypothetical protein VGE52_16370 [Pirellulales bacterium]
MWKCPKCAEALEDNFDACWHCGSLRDRTPAIDAPIQSLEDDNANEKDAASVDGREDQESTTSDEEATPDGTPARRKSVKHDGPRHFLAHGLVLVFRGFALLTAGLGAWMIVDATTAYRSVTADSDRWNMMAAEHRQFNQAASKAAFTALCTAVISTLAVVSVSLAFAEGLRLGLLIEQNTRPTRPRRDRKDDHRKQRDR